MAARHIFFPSQWPVERTLPLARILLRYELDHPHKFSEAHIRSPELNGYPARELPN